MFREVEVRYHTGSMTRGSLPGSSAPTYGYTSSTYLPQGTQHGSSYRQRPALSYQQSWHPTAQSTTTYQPPPSTRQRVPQDQSRGSGYRSSSRDPGHASGAGALIPYDNRNSIESWAHGVRPGHPTASLVGSNTKRTTSSSHRSDKSRGRESRRDKEKSRDGSVSRSSRGHGSNAGGRADGRTPKQDPRLGTIREESSTHHSRHPKATRKK